MPARSPASKPRRPWPTTRWRSIRHRLGEGVTERTFAFELETAMRELGADGPSFETIVGSGPNGAKPHARPSERPIGRR